MNYILVNEEQLEGKYDAQYCERTTDGRVILPVSVLKVVTGLKDIDIVSLKEAKALKAESPIENNDSQEDNSENNPPQENISDNEDNDTQNDNVEGEDEGQGTDSESEENNENTEQQ